MAVVVKVQGFGTGPGTRAMPFVSSPVTFTVRAIDAGKGERWLSMTTRSPCVQFHWNGKPGSGEKEPVTVPRLMGFENVTTMVAPQATSVAPFAGSVLTIRGGRQTVVNVHGFGFDPVMFVRGFPDVSLADTVTVLGRKPVYGGVPLASLASAALEAQYELADRHSSAALR